MYFGPREESPKTDKNQKIFFVLGGSSNSLSHFIHQLFLVLKDVAGNEAQIHEACTSASHRKQNLYIISSRHFLCNSPRHCIHQLSNFIQMLQAMKLKDRRLAPRRVIVSKTFI